MAAPTAIAKKASDAQQRITEAGPQLAARLGVDWPAVVKSKDPQLQRARELEALADFLDAALETVKGSTGAAPAETAATETDADKQDEAVPYELRKAREEAAANAAEDAASADTAPDAPARPTRRRTARSGER